jgi:ABC-type phosphate/phosphonate transport system substrate-binding protein
MAISTATMAGANINDARAAYKVWLGQAAQYYGRRTAVVVPDIFIPSKDLVRGVREGSLDAYGATAIEVKELLDVTELDFMLIQDYMANGMEYVLLVHNSSTFKKLADLRGAQLVTHLHRDMLLLPAWLGTILAEDNLPQPNRFFASQKESDKVNQVVLPVFFRRVDAACLARHDWETAVELNPQLGRDLRPLVVSSRLLPIGCFFRKSTSPEARQALLRSIQSINSVTAGREIVALYQSQSFVIRTVATMKPTLDMLRQFERIQVPQANLRKGAA